MPEHIRAVIVILVLATITFALAHRSACDISSTKNFTRRRNIWIALTLAAFLAPSFWLYLVVAAPLLIYTNRRESNPPALYFFILFVLPLAPIRIPGMGLANYLLDLNHARVLELLILLPAFITLRKQSDMLSFGRTTPDKALAAFLFLSTVLILRDDTQTLTNYLRMSLYAFLDVLLPYIVISRSLKNLQSFRDALLSLVLAIMVLAPMAVFEFSKSWLLYSALNVNLGLEGGMTGYLGRDGMIRALVSTGQPIALGYLMVVGIGLYLFIQRSIQSKFIRRLGIILLVAGLMAPLSRGPWIGSIVLIVAFIITGRYAMRRLMGLAIVAMLALSLASILPGGEKVMNLLPFIGTTDQFNVDYRERLVTNSMIVISRNPWFGSVDCMNTPEMEAMRQGEGIIDIVNTYLGLALYYGYVGAGLFVAFFALTLLGIYRAMHSLPDSESEEYLLGRVLLSTLLAILVMIFSVSTITIVPYIYWLVAAMGVAYAQMVRK